MLLKRDRQTACNRTSIMKTRMRQNVRKQKRIAVQMRTAQRKAQQRKTQRMRRTKVLQMIQIRQPQQEAANQIHRLQAASRSQSAAVTVLIQWQESCTKPDLSVMPLPMTDISARMATIRKSAQASRQSLQVPTRRRLQRF